MELIRNYFLTLLIIVLTRQIDGGIVKKMPLHQSPVELQETVSELDEKEAPLTKRQSVPFYVNNPFISVSTFPPQQQQHTEIPNTQFTNYQKPIKIPIQEFTNVQSQQSFVNYENNPFISGSVSVPVLSVTSTPVVTSTPSYVNNPFINTQQVNSNVNNVYPTFPVTFKPVVTSSPSYSNNPFLNVNGESVHTAYPVQVTPTTTVRPTFPPQQQEHTQIPNNQYTHYQKPIIIPIQEFSKVPPQQSFVNYGNNPFISGSVSVPVFPVTSTPAVTSTPSYTNNPFLNVHSESIQTSHPVQVTSTTTATPSVSSTQLNTNNPFFNPSIVTAPTTTYIPVEIPRQPVEVQVQLEQSNQLRSFCAKARGQFPSGRCNTFVNCWDNVAVEQSCPPGLVFNFAGYCDYPQNVDCYGRNVEEIFAPQTPQAGSFITNGPSNEVNKPALPYPGVNTDTTFVPSSTILPPFPDVTNTIPPVVYVPPPVDEKLKVKCLKPRGQFPSELCNRYIDCWDDSIQEYECPEGLYFSEKGYCDYLYNVNCQNRTLHKADLTESSLCPHRDGSFQDRNNCSKYFICINNVVAGYNECPEGLYFNEMVSVCDYKHNVNCFREPFVYQPPQTQNHIDKIPAGILSATKNCEPGKVFKLANDCSSAVLCRQGITEVVYCPNGLAYDPQSDRCLPQQLAKCQDL